MVASIGVDTNGDGVLDILLGSPEADGPAHSRPDAGEAYVIFGKATGFGPIDLSDLDAAQGFAIQGGAAGFVTSLEGAEDTVIGLPIEVVRRLLADW